MKIKLSALVKIASSLVFLTISTRAQAAITCTLPPLKFAVSGNGKYIHNSCNETGAGSNCITARNNGGQNNGDFKNSEILFTGFELTNISKYGYKEGKAIIEAIGSYFDQNADGTIDYKDCPPFRVAIVGHSHGAWAAAKVAAYLKQYNKAGSKKIADFDNDFLLRVGLIDAIETGFPRGFGQLNSNAHKMPKDNACVYNMFQRGTNQGGCPDTYCKPLDGAFNNLIYYGEQFLDSRGTSPVIDFEKDWTGLYVDTKIDTGSSTTQSQEAHHMNMETPAKELAEYVLNGGSTPVSPAELFAGCGQPTFLNANSASTQTPTTPTSDSRQVIGAIGSGTTLAALQATMGAARVAAAMENIPRFRSLSQAAVTEIEKPGSSTTITAELRSKVSALAALPVLERNMTGAEVSTEFDVQDGEVSTLFSTQSSKLAYLTPTRKGSTLTLNIAYQLPQMFSAATAYGYNFLKHGNARFYGADLNDVYDYNIALLLDNTLPTNVATWDSELKVLLPQSFVKTTLNGGSEKFYPWNFTSETNPEDNVYLQASGLALDFSKGQARIVLQGLNVTFLQNIGGNTWVPFVDYDSSTGYPIADTIIKSNAELQDFFANLGFKQNDPDNYFGSFVTVGLEFITSGGTSKQVSQTLILDKPAFNATSIERSDNYPINPNFDVIVPKELGLDR